MMAYTKRQLESLPLEMGEQEEMASLIVQKSQGIFLWLKLALEEILATVHAREYLHDALEAIPSNMDEFYERILDTMSENLRQNTKPLAKAILQYTVCATRPLKATELHAALESKFGRQFNIKYTINHICPHLLSIDETTSLVNPIHGTVREFLLQSHESEFSVDAVQAHAELSRVCLQVWQDEVLSKPVSQYVTGSKSGISASLESVHPLLSYSTQSWFEHIKNCHADKETVSSLYEFLKHKSVLSWIETVALLDQLWFLTQAAKALESFVISCPLNLPEKKFITVIAGWAVDFARIVLRFGRDVVAHPSSIHKLIPPFCPSNTRVGSQFGALGAISVVGTAMRNWDDCLAHITVGRDGELCKALACGNKSVVVALCDRDGTVVLYVSETCQEYQRLQHGERIGAISIDGTGEQVITAGPCFIKVWNVKRGEKIAQFTNDASTRCIAVSFHNKKKVASFSSDNTLSLWDIKNGTREHTRISRPVNETRHRGAPWSATFDGEGICMAVAYKGWPVEVWNIEERRIVAQIPMRNPLSACFNPLTEGIYSVDADGTVKRYSVENDEVEINAQSHTLACSPDGTLLATGNGRGCLQVYSTDMLQLLYSIDKYDDSITALAFSPDGERLYDIRNSDWNVWVPEILLVNLESSRPRSEESETRRLPTSSILDSNNSVHDITSLCSDVTGDYICCGKSNGIVSIYHARTGKQLQEIYKHAPTVSIAAIVWSLNGRIVASGDNPGRVIVASLEADSVRGWKCTKKHDFRLDPRMSGGIRQVLVSEDGERLLVSSQLASNIFRLEDGSLAGARYDQEREGTPSWLTHPQDPSKVIMMGSERARILKWDDFSELTAQHGISLTKHVAREDDGREFAGNSQQTQAYVTSNGQHIISAVSTQSSRSAHVTCYSSSIEGFSEENNTIEVTQVSKEADIHDFVGVYENNAVFLDKNLWVCTQSVEKGEALTQHFYVPVDWLNTSGDRPSAITSRGDFVYAKHGELIIVHKGMRCKREF